MSDFSIDQSFSLIYQKAKKQAHQAYVPYSHFPVGCALKMHHHDSVFFACNVENASYGGTICAERNAMTTVVSQMGGQLAHQSSIEWILVVGIQKLAYPCGICLQFLDEFSGGHAFPVYLADKEKIQKRLLFDQLLPYGFNLN